MFYTLFMSGGLWQFEQGVQGVQNAFMLETNKCFVICFRRQDSSIGFGSPVRANMRGQRLIDAAITSSLLETVNWQILLVPVLVLGSMFIKLHVMPSGFLDTIVVCSDVVLGGIWIQMQVFEPWILACCTTVEGGLQVESSDLIAYGLIPEFTGRFPVLVSLAALNEDQLVQVLMTPRAPYQVPETKHLYFLGVCDCHSLVF
jgi:hypothetical protein